MPKKMRKEQGIQIPKKLWRSTTKAISQWGMIKQGDRVLLGLSGGKDSLALLHVLLALQKKYAPGSWTLAAATVDPGTEAFNPKPLIPYVESLGVPYHYIETPIMQWAKDGHMQGDSICAFCARMKRGALYSCCREHGYNKLVLAQHLDDLVESFFMSSMYNSKFRTMKAHYPINEGDLRVIRPLVYTREKALRDFSYGAGLPVIAENCPACFEEPKERHHVKKMLAKQETLFPNLFSCLCKALTPMMDPVVEDVITSAGAEVETRGLGARRKARYDAQERGEDTTAAWVRDQEGRAGLTDEQAAALAAVSERALFGELARRYQAGHKGKAKGGELASYRRRAGGPEANGPPAGAGADRELEGDLYEKQALCTADGCPRPSSAAEFEGGG